MIIAILLFIAVGLAFGYAFGGLLAWIVALGLPIVVALFTIRGGGTDDFNVASFVITMLLTALAVVVGMMLRGRGRREPHSA